MNDEKVREYAKRIIRETLEQFDIKLPDFVQKHESEDGKIIFFLTLSSKESGEINIRYDPLGAVEEIIKISQFTEDSRSKLQKLQNNIIVRGTTYILLKNFAWEFAEVFSFQPILAKLSMPLSTRMRREKRGKRNVSATEISKEADEIIKILAKSRKERILAEYKVTKDASTPPKVIFARLYEVRLKKWQEANKCYKQNKEYESWVAMVKAAFPLLDEELIAHLGDANPYVSMPSSIALIDTARLLEMPQATAQLRTLQDLLKKSREHLKMENPDKVDEQVNRFFRDLTERDNIREKINQLAENDAEDSNESLQ